MANIIITGNVGSSDLKFTPNGKAVLDFTVADNLRRLNKQTNQWEDVSTTWWRVQVWEKKAEDLADAVQKGTRVVVVGDVHSRDYETRDGEKRTVYDVKASTVGVLPRGGGRQGAGFTPSAGAATDPWNAPAQSDDGNPF